MKQILVVIIALIMFAVATVEVAAAEYGGIGIRPANPDPKNPLSESWFIYNLLSGENKTDKVVISNSSDKMVRVKVYPVDGTTTADGAFALLNETDKKEDVGSWVVLEKGEVDLAPGNQEEVTFSISVPVGARVGDHLGGIVIENMAVGKTQGVSVVSRVGVRIYQTVPGDLIKKLVLRDLSFAMVDSKPTLYFDLVNEGNVRVEPKAALTIKDGVLGLPLFKIDTDLRMVVPGKPTRVPVVWQRYWPLGKFLAKVQIVYGDEPGQRIEREVEFSYIGAKVKMVITGAVVVLVVVLVLMFRKRR